MKSPFLMSSTALIFSIWCLPAFHWVEKQWGYPSTFSLLCSVLISNQKRREKEESENQSRIKFRRKIKYCIFLLSSVLILPFPCISILIFHLYAFHTNVFALSLGEKTDVTGNMEDTKKERLKVLQVSLSNLLVVKLF